MPEKYALVEHSSAINTIIRNTFQSTHRIKFTAFEVSHKYVVFGATSGGIYIFTREPCQFLKLIPSTHGPTNLLRISPNEENLAIAVSSGLVIILEGCFSPTFEQQVYTEHEGHTVTAMTWNGNDLYCGDSIGRVSVVTLHNFLAMFQPPAACLMHLESRIVQLDAYSKFLLVSTQTRSLLCDTESERFRQIGKKTRDGPFGACFLLNSDILKEDGDISIRTRGVYKTLGENEELSSVVNDGIKIYCARPGIRLWRADFQANVVVTHQFRPSLTKKQSNIVQWDDCDQLKIKSFDGGGITEFNFGTIFSFLGKFILSFRSDGFYIFEPSSSALLHWSAHISNIKDIKVVNSYLYIWHCDLEVSVLSLLTIEELILRSLMRKKYKLCGELCVEFHDEVESLLTTSKKIHLISVLESKLDKELYILEKMGPIFERLKDAENAPSLEKYRNGIVTVNALPVQSLLPESVQEFQCEDDGKKPLSIVFEQFKINKIHKTIETTDFAQLVHSLDTQNFYNLFIEFEKTNENSDFWCKETFLKYLNFSDNITSEVLEYACQAFLQVNHETLICKCDCPLPQAHEKAPKYYETGCKLMEKSDNYDQFLKNVPFMHKYVLENNKDIHLRISLIIQFSDPEILEKHLNRITYDVWDEATKLLLKLRTGQCLNCGTNIDPGGSFEWTTFGVLMSQSIKPTNAIKLLKRYAKLLPQLDQFFYQYCILLASSSSSSNILKTTLFDDKVRKQFETSVGGFLRRKYLRGGDHDSPKPIELHNCDHCHTPLKIPIIEEIIKLPCGHTYHRVCFMYNNEQCSVCDYNLLQK